MAGRLDLKSPKTYWYDEMKQVGYERKYTITGLHKIPPFCHKGVGLDVEDDSHLIYKWICIARTNNCMARLDVMARGL
jgi:hypothetical protein